MIAVMTVLAAALALGAVQASFAQGAGGDAGGGAGGSELVPVQEAVPVQRRCRCWRRGSGRRRCWRQRKREHRSRRSRCWKCQGARNTKTPSSTGLPQKEDRR